MRIHKSWNNRSRVIRVYYIRVRGSACMCVCVSIDFEWEGSVAVDKTDNTIVFLSCFFFHVNVQKSEENNNLGLAITKRSITLARLVYIYIYNKY